MISLSVWRVATGAMVLGGIGAAMLVSGCSSGGSQNYSLGSPPIPSEPVLVRGQQLQRSAVLEPGARHVPQNIPTRRAEPRQGHALASDRTIVVQPGDTLNRISLRYRVTISELMHENGLRSPTIVVGQRLRIPRFR